ncbi:MAG: histidine kinase [Opitutae bacterium]|nr:histidine kinase [Opitutae bacterium]
MRPASAFLFSLACFSESLALTGAATAAETGASGVATEPDSRTRAIERGQPVARLFLPREYRGHHQIWRIAELPDGRMLFGNLDQVLEFDGLRWQAIPVPGGSFIRALEVDAAGIAWVGGVNELGRLVGGADGQLRYESLRARVPAELGDIGAVWSLHAMRDGVYFQTSAATLRWNGTRFDVWRIGEKGVVGAFPVDGRLIVSRERAWFTPGPDGTWEQIAENPMLPRHLWRTAEGRLLALTGGRGVVTVDGATLSPLAMEIDEWLKTKRPYAAFALPGGRLVIPSLQGGAVVLGPDFRLEETFDATAGLPSDTAITAHLDRHGALWLGTDNGVVRLDYRSPVRVFGSAHGFGSSGPESISRVDGKILVSTARGIFELQAPERLPGSPRLRESQAYNDRATELVRFPDGVLAGGLEGLTWISGGKSTRLEGPPAVRSVRDPVRLPGATERILATFINGVASWRRAGGGWQFEGIWPELSGELRSPTIDRDGALWLATPSAGVLRIEPSPTEPKAQKIERFAEAAGLPVERRMVWLKLAGGAPLFMTHRGFFRWDATARRFVPERRYGDRFGGGDAFVRVAAEDGHGGLWMSVESRGPEPGEIVYGRDGRWERLPMPDLDQLGALTQLAWEEQNGREILWMAGQSELRRVDLTAWRQNPPPAIGATLLRSVQVGRDRRALASAGVAPTNLSFKENTVRFTFATPGLGGETGVLHESRLIGFLDDELQRSNAGERTFTNLPEGSYVFETRARSTDGRWSEPARFAFVVLAPWWRTTAAVAFYLFGGTFAIFTYVRWRLRRLLRERNRLEDVIAMRTAELARKNVELERLHRLDQNEKLAARLAEEKAQLELLRYQLNPHFLYNSLNSIRALVFSNADAAGEMVTRLSEFCRGTLTRGGDGMTTVAEEVEMLRAYLDIERTRWQEGLLTRIHVDPAACAVSLPSFLFLPLIENAIKYGGKTSPSVLEVAVTIRLDDDVLVAEIANTGTWVGEKFGSAAPTPESTHIGLENLRRRLARYYGPQCRPHIVTEEGWVRVRLRLPQKVRSGSEVAV